MENLTHELSRQARWFGWNRLMNFYQLTIRYWAEGEASEDWVTV